MVDRYYRVNVDGTDQFIALYRNEIENTLGGSPPTPTPPATPTPDPDMVITAFSASPAAPSTGQAVTFSITIQNQGQAAVAASTVTTGVYIDGTRTTQATFASGLAAGASVTIDTTAQPWTATTGTHSVYAYVNDNGAITEANSANNLSSTLTLGTASGVDLVVTALTWTPTNPITGQGVTFYITIQNVGAVAIPANTNFGTGVYIDGRVMTWANYNTGLAAGASVTFDTVTSLWPGGLWLATEGEHTIQAWVDDTNLIAESNENNNQWNTTMTVAPPVGGTPDVTNRGSTNAITAGTTIVSGGFTPASGSVVVVIVKGTTL